MLSFRRSWSAFACPSGRALSPSGRRFWQPCRGRPSCRRTCRPFSQPGCTTTAPPWPARQSTRSGHRTEATAGGTYSTISQAVEKKITCQNRTQLWCLRNRSEGKSLMTGGKKKRRRELWNENTDQAWRRGALWFTLRSRNVKTVSEVRHVVGKIKQTGMQLETATHVLGAKRLQEKDGAQPERIPRVLPNCNLSLNLELDCFLFFWTESGIWAKDCCCKFVLFSRKLWWTFVSHCFTSKLASSSTAGATTCVPWPWIWFAPLSVTSLPDS